MTQHSEPFSNLSTRAMTIRALYEQLEEKKYGRCWTTEELTLGFVGDVGDLVKLIQAHEGIRAIDNHENKLAHELADCLWSLMVLAKKCDIDLEASFSQTMDELEATVTKRLA